MLSMHTWKFDKSGHHHIWIKFYSYTIGAAIDQTKNIIFVIYFMIR